MKPTIGIMTVVVAISCVHDVNSLNILPVTDFGSPSAPRALDSFCPQNCPAVMSPVFDENGVMYSNRCKMQAAKCKQRKNDGITSPAPTKAPSNLDSFCPEVCPAVMKPVLDENGVMYTNECKMQAAKCKKKKHAKVETDESGSNTDDSASDEEASDEDDSDGVTQDGSSSPSMKCKGACPDIKLLVCGSDDVQYANPCQLELARCKNPELNIVEDDDAACFSAKKTTTQDEKTGQVGQKADDPGVQRARVSCYNLNTLILQKYLSVYRVKLGLNVLISHSCVATFISTSVHQYSECTGDVEVLQTVNVRFQISLQTINVWLQIFPFRHTTRTQLHFSPIMASSGGMSNADFARMFRKEAREEAVNQDTDTHQDASSTNPTSHELDPMQAAARRRRQEMDPTNSSQDTEEAPRGSGLVFRSGIGFTSGSGSGAGLGTDTTDTAASKPVKTKTYGWEKHTTGFGTKMLAKMGFKGRLGKKEDGVSATIEVKKRPAQMGVGYGDFVEASNLKQNRKLQKELKGESVDDEEVAGVVQEDDTLWRKRKVVAVGRKRHKRAAELTQEAHDMKKHKRSDVVLDMRGPSVRVLSDVTAAYDVDAHRVEAAKSKLGDELIYNVRMVVNLAQGKIYDLTQKIDANQENVVAMKKEAKLIKAQLNVDDVRLQHMQSLVEQMKALDKLRENALEMQSVEPILTHLRAVRRSFPLEFDAHKLQQLVPSICMPPLRALLMESDLLDQKSSDGVLHQFRMIQMFLTELPSNRAAKDANQSASVLPVIREKTMAESDDLHNFILEETLWPAMVQCVNVDWKAKTAPTDCVDVFLKFRPHLSSEFEEAFLDQLVLSRLKKECHRWDPRLDTIPIHKWLLPWLPFVGRAMKSLYPDIQLAIAGALNQWHPSDLSVLAVLSPWRELWGEREYGKFTHRHIVRKLIRCLHREFEINPENQSLEALAWVLAWKDYLPDRQFIALLEGEFFPKWLKVLRKWVSGSPNLAELEKWYCGWKLLFEKNKLATNERLLVHFHGALVLLQVASESVGVTPENKPPVPELNGSAATNYQDALALARDDEVKEPPVREEKASPRGVSSRSVSLKDVIENMAINHNLTFMPKGFHDGQQVYTFGKRQIIIEQGVVFKEESKGAFKPVDLEQLL